MHGWWLLSHNPHLDKVIYKHTRCIKDHFNSKIWNDTMMLVFVLFPSSQTCSILNTGVTVITYIAHAHCMYVKNKYMRLNYINLPLSSCLLLQEFSPVSLCRCSSSVPTHSNAWCSDTHKFSIYIILTIFQNLKKWWWDVVFWNHYTCTPSRVSNFAGQ